MGEKISPGPRMKGGRGRFSINCLIHFREKTSLTSVRQKTLRMSNEMFVFAIRWRKRIGTFNWKDQEEFWRKKKGWVVAQNFSEVPWFQFKLNILAPGSQTLEAGSCASYKLQLLWFPGNSLRRILEQVPRTFIFLRSSKLFKTTKPSQMRQNTTDDKSRSLALFKRSLFYGSPMRVIML